MFLLYRKNTNGGLHRCKRGRCAVARQDWKAVFQKRIQEIRLWRLQGEPAERIAERLGMPPSIYGRLAKGLAEEVPLRLDGEEALDFALRALFKKAVGFSYEEVVREKAGAGVLQEKGRWELALSYFNHCCACCGGDGKLYRLQAGEALENGRGVLLPVCAACRKTIGKEGLASWLRNCRQIDREAHMRIVCFGKLLGLLAGEAEEPLSVTKVVCKQCPPDTAALTLWLKGMHPSLWAAEEEAQEITVDVELTGEGA